MQVLPQPAQFDEVPSVVSHPAVAVQSANPELHAPIVQAPVVHEAAAFGNEQAVLQSPQSLSVRTLRSQPLSARLSQLFQPVSHVGEHPPAPHAVVPCALAQASPQARQFATVPSVVSPPNTRRTCTCRRRTTRSIAGCRTRCRRSRSSRY